MSGDDDYAVYDACGVEEEEGDQFLGTQQYDDGNDEFVNDNFLDDLMYPGGDNDDDPLPALRTFGSVR